LVIWSFILIYLTQALPCNLGTPCVYGTCYNDYIGGYDCACDIGYIGTNCTIRKFFFYFESSFKSYFFRSRV
jgi:hypothetical protein